MMPWHPRCDAVDCHYRCQRPGCPEPDVHFLVRNGAHSYDCATPVSLARQVVDELRPGMAPDEIAIARRVLLNALEQLERQERRRPTICQAETA